tara:strand:- start:50 stop:526 length:477 start_codon:yes stop_codon:yes gene_type:complete
MTFIPESPNTYQGNQVMINSDRLVFNAKKDHILLYSDKSIGFSAMGNFHFDTDNSVDTKFIVNAPNIYLGLRSLTTGELPTEPAVLGHELKQILEQILDFLQQLVLDMVGSISYIVTEPGTPTGMNADNFDCLESRYQDIENIKKNIDDMMSKTTKLI